MNTLEKVLEAKSIQYGVKNLSVKLLQQWYDHMAFVTYLGIYFLLWWIVFFFTLPFKISTIEEEGVSEEGQAPSAPIKPRILIKMLFTTIFSLIIILLFNFFIRLFDINVFDILSISG